MYCPLPQSLSPNMSRSGSLAVALPRSRPLLLWIVCVGNFLSCVSALPCEAGLYAVADSEFTKAYKDNSREEIQTADDMRYMDLGIFLYVPKSINAGATGVVVDLALHHQVGEQRFVEEDNSTTASSPAVVANATRKSATTTSTTCCFAGMLGGLADSCTPWLPCCAAVFQQVGVDYEIFYQTHSFRGRFLCHSVLVKG